MVESLSKSHDTYTKRASHPLVNFVACSQPHGAAISIAAAHVANELGYTDVDGEIRKPVHSDNLTGHQTVVKNGF